MMSRINELIERYCPDGVEYRPFADACTLHARIGWQRLTKAEQRLSGDYLLVTGTDFTPSGKIEYGTCVYVDKNRYDQDKNIQLQNGDVLITKDGTLGKVAVVENLPKPATLNGGVFVVRDRSGLLNNRFIAHYLLSSHFAHTVQAQSTGSTIKHLTQKLFSRLMIPVPPIPVQEEIVRVLDSFAELEAELEAEQEARKRQYAYYRDRLLSFEGERVRRIPLGDIGPICMCKRIYKNQTSKSGEVPFYKIGTFGGNADAYISRELFEEYKSRYSYPNTGDLLISCSGTIGKTVQYQGEEAYFQDSNIIWVSNDESVVLNDYLKYWYEVAKWPISKGGTISRLYTKDIKRMQISVPPIKEQQRIVETLDQFEALTNSPTSGLPAEIEARRKQYQYYRDELMTFKEKVS